METQEVRRARRAGPGVWAAQASRRSADDGEQRYAPFARTFADHAQRAGGDPEFGRLGRVALERTRVDPRRPRGERAPVSARGVNHEIRADAAVGVRVVYRALAVSQSCRFVLSLRDLGESDRLGYRRRRRSLRRQDRRRLRLRNGIQAVSHESVAARRRQVYALHLHRRDGARRVGE